MMKKIAIIGSDSFIAGKFISAYINKYSLKLFARKPSSAMNVILFPDLRDIKSDDLDGVDVVINFAAIVHQPNVKDESIYLRVNTELPIHLATQSRKAGVKHFIQMSTIAVYGKANSINENTKENPVNSYGKSKLMADKALLLMEQDNFKISLVRAPMVYGGGLAPGNMQRLIKLALKGFPLPFKGINNKRDFIHVHNLVLALSIIINQEIYKVILPTDKNPVSTEQILSIIRKYSSKKVRLIPISGFLLYFIKNTLPSMYEKLYGNLLVSCTLNDIHYKPKYTIHDGIREMLIAINKSNTFVLK